MSKLDTANEKLCTQCQEPVLSKWKVCPACGTALESAESTRQVVATGDASVVKASIRSPENLSQQRNAPLVQTGSESVVKAEIDASSNVHHHGQFVENQTIVNESSVGALIRMMTTGFSASKTSKIEQQISAVGDDPAQLYSVLAQTLRHVIREAKRKARDEAGLFEGAFSMRALAGPIFAKALSKLKDFTPKGKERIHQLELCRKISDKLHDIAYAKNDASLIADVEKLDECLSTTQRTLKMQDSLPVLKCWMVIAIFSAPLALLGSFATGGEMIFAGFFYAAVAVVTFVFVKQRLEGVQNGIVEIEKTITELARKL